MTNIDDNWDYKIPFDDIVRDTKRHFYDSVSNISDRVLKILVDGFQTQKGNKTQNKDLLLKKLVDKNKELTNEINNKMEECEKNQAMYENFKQDRRLLSEEIKDTYEAFLMAKKYYKKFLKIYYTIESTNVDAEIIFVQFFTESRKENDIYSVRFSKNLASGHYELIDTNPEIKEFTEIQKKLKETRDVPRAVSCIREVFLKLCKTKDSKN